MKTNISHRLKILNWNYSLIIFLLFIISCSKQPNQIYIDGRFTDWQHLSPVYEANIGDHPTGNLDFGKLWITNDAEYLYLCIEVGTEINLQDDNEMALFIDTDNDSNSGERVSGIGADLVYHFGKRKGTFYPNVQSDSIIISQYSIGLVTSPTVTSDQFEIAIKRSSLPDGKSPLFRENGFRMIIRDLAEGGDVLPNELGGIKYIFQNSTPKKPIPISLKQENPNSLRIMTYNVLGDGLLKPEQYPSMSKIIKAIQPQIMVFQEIYNYDADTALKQIEKITPPNEQQQWYSIKEGQDVIIVSRYPIESSTSIDGNGAFLLDLYSKFESKILLIGAHLPCCANNEGRRNEIDALMQFIHETKESESEIPLSENTPIIILGDCNLVGDAQQLQTLLTGDIQDTIRFGSRFSPDWDHSSFADLLPYCTNIPFAFTWYDRYSSFSPGRLDFIIYSDSVIQPVKKFVLFTPAIPADTLATYGLESDDVLNASDHLPVIADFILKNNQ
jgi:exonuclease III